MMMSSSMMATTVVMMRVTVVSGDLGRRGVKHFD